MGLQVFFTVSSALLIHMFKCLHLLTFPARTTLYCLSVTPMDTRTITCTNCPSCSSTVMHQLPLHVAPQCTTCPACSSTVTPADPPCSSTVMHQLPLNAAALLGALTKPKTQSQGSKQQPSMQEAEGMLVGHCRGRVS